MEVTSRYLGTQRAGVEYLFFLLTEDYFQEHRRLVEEFDPLLVKFARDLGDSGAVVRPFKGDEKKTLSHAQMKNWPDGIKRRMQDKLPALLAINVDFDAFDPAENPYLFISFRDSMDQYGNIEIFKLQELFSVFVRAAKEHRLFEEAGAVLRKQRFIEAFDAIELKPGMFGLAIDLKKATKLLKELSL